jgi:hypothetical protein
MPGFTSVMVELQSLPKEGTDRKDPRVTMPPGSFCGLSGEAAEGIMSDERRDNERSPEFRNVELVAVNDNGNEKSFPVTLRDTSDRGLGGMYVGDDTLKPAATFVLRDADKEADCRVRIVWTKKVAEYVQMLGIEVSEN